MMAGVTPASMVERRIPRVAVTKDDIAKVARVALYQKEERHEMNPVKYEKLNCLKVLCG